MSPRVSIGIPTFNRANLLGRAIESALVQCDDLEVLIVDNASTDGTRELCEAYAKRDPRIRYVRHATNLGAVANFAAALELAQGHYFLWLGDDDWLDPGYVTACVALLDRSPEHMLVSGMARYYQAGATVPVRDDQLMVLEQATPFERVIAYFSLVRENGVFYGVSRRQDLLRIGRFDHFGGDWLHVASLAFLGKVRTLEQVFVHRTLGGASTTQGVVALFGLKGYFSKEENLVMHLAWRMYVDLSSNTRVLQSLSPLHRHWIGLAAADSLIAGRYGSRTLFLRSRVAPRRRLRALKARLEAMLRD